MTDPMWRHREKAMLACLERAVAAQEKAVRDLEARLEWRRVCEEKQAEIDKHDEKRPAHGFLLRALRRLAKLNPADGGHAGPTDDPSPGWENAVRAIEERYTDLSLSNEPVA